MPEATSIQAQHSNSDLHYPFIVGIISSMSPFARRDFLKISTLSLGAMAFRPHAKDYSLLKGTDVGRIAIDQLSVYSAPDDKSRIISQHFRDELVNIYEDVISDKGPAFNPLWYRVWRGYMHSARIQKVKTNLNEPLSTVPASGLLTEITVPYTQAYRYTKTFGWQPIYRLYYGSLHWIIGLEEGPDGQPWYRIRDELLANPQENYHAPAIHMRYIQPEEYSPLSPDIPPGDKSIEVNLNTQTLVAYEGSKEVFKTNISSGLANSLIGKKVSNTETPRGNFNVFRKIPSKHMGGGLFTADPEAYILPGVPWDSFFTESGVAFHGTWWHNNFGVPMSHGCINMRTAEAKWIFRWTTPVNPPNTVETNGMGTRVHVF
jgi:lipoprotein-anchoring transpeptidase ErfK/SrfK